MSAAAELVDMRTLMGDTRATALLTSGAAVHANISLPRVGVTLEAPFRMHSLTSGHESACICGARTVPICGLVSPDYQCIHSTAYQRQGGRAGSIAHTEDRSHVFTIEKGSCAFFL